MPVHREHIKPRPDPEQLADARRRAAFAAEHVLGCSNRDAERVLALDTLADFISEIYEGPCEQLSWALMWAEKRFDLEEHETRLRARTPGKGSTTRSNAPSGSGSVYRASGSSAASIHAQEVAAADALLQRRRRPCPAHRGVGARHIDELELQRRLDRGRDKLLVDHRPAYSCTPHLGYVKPLPDGSAARIAGVGEGSSGP